MAGSKIRLYGSTSGYVELEAPAVAPDGVLTLPTGTGGFGKTLQVVQTVKTDAFTTTSTAFTAVTGLSAAITPSSTTSKVLVLVSLTIGGADTIATSAFRLMRGATAISVADAAGSKARATALLGIGANSSANVRRQGNTGAFVFLDSPGVTASTTYSVQVMTGSAASTTLYVNRTGEEEGDSGGSASARSVSSITVIEVAA